MAQKWVCAVKKCILNSALNEKKAEVRVQYKPVNGDIYPAGELKRYCRFPIVILILVAT